jgi:hypothetical protein
MRVVIVLVVVIAVAVFIAMALAALRDRARSAKALWRVTNRTLPDATIVVGIARGDEFREVKAIPPAEATDVVADVRLAREDAEMLAEELNRGIRPSG